MDATEAEIWNIIKLSPVKSCELDHLSTTELIGYWTLNYYYYYYLASEGMQS